MRMAIEEPRPSALFIRFIYDDGRSEMEDQENEVYNDFRRSAYIEADIDTVKVMREMHDIGRLNNLLT
jgi:hypothetical protein